MRLPVEVSEGQFAEQLIWLFCTRHNMRLILAIVELRCSAQFLVLLRLSELLQLLQVAWKLVAIQGAFNLLAICELKEGMVQEKSFEVQG